MGKIMQDKQSINAPKRGPSNGIKKLIRVGFAAAILLIGAICILIPNFNPLRFQRIILFLVIALLPALLFAENIQAKLKLKLPGVSFVAAGTFAAILGTTILLDNLAKPEQQIAGYNIYRKDSSGKTTQMELDKRMVSLETRAESPQSLFVDNNTLLIVFPDQSPTAVIMIKPYGDDETFYREVSFSKSRIDNVLTFPDDFTVDREGVK